MDTRPRSVGTSSGAPSRAPAPLPPDAAALAAPAARRDPHVHLAPRALPAAPAARPARPALDVAGALAGRARLLEVERERPARAGERLLERDLDGGLDVRAAPRPP